MCRRAPVILLTLLPALLLAVALGGAARAAGQAPAAPPPPHLGYGFNVATLDLPLVQELDFDWVKLFGPPGARLPVHVLLRQDANATHLADVDAFAERLGLLAREYGAFIEGYEIGNEPNLDAAYGWGAAPDAAAYVALLCAAYERIKAEDPASVVVSAGLAPTGRVTGSWEGHAGHNGRVQDEREWLREFIAAGGAACADAVGYHPYGFSADYDAPPDVAAADPTQNCANGFCFRGVEAVHALLAAEGLAALSIWATEFGWIVDPADEGLEPCLDDSRFEGRHWQLVSPEKQAANLAGAFAYADANWPWMGPMFVFNLNFNSVNWYDTCEQMRFYAVAGRPAEEALRQMAKRPAPLAGRLVAEPIAFHLLAPAAGQPLTHTLALRLRNGGLVTFPYTVTVSPAGLTPTVAARAGVLAPGAAVTMPLTVTSRARPPGLYTATARVDAPGATGAPLTATLSLRLTHGTEWIYLPWAGR